MSCSPEILLFVEDCEKRERRKKFIIDEERSYRLRTSSPISQETSETPDLEECGNILSRELPDGIVKWGGEYRGRGLGERYSEEEILHAQKEGLVLWTMTVAQGQHGYYREEVWFSKEKNEEEYWSSEDEGYICCPGWMSPEEYFEGSEESYPDEVKKKAIEIMEKANWLPNFSHPTGRGKYFLKGKSGESGFISWKEGETLCYVSDEKGNVLQTNGKPEQYKGFKGREKKRYRHLLGKSLLDYFAP